MPFVYVHVVVFAGWMLFVEESPWPTLTLVVSLEAIFLSTFVLIGQNRASAFQQEKADHDFLEQETELKTNTELTREIHKLTTELHQPRDRPGVTRPPPRPPCHPGERLGAGGWHLHVRATTRAITTT